MSNEAHREKARRDFLNNAEGMKMTVALDSGLYRHLRFRGSNFCGWFEIVTWPGCLTINGDYGCWSFSRVDDMFAFFRSRDGELEINSGYWEEKLLACDRNAKAASKFDAEYFVRCLIDSLDNCDLDADDKKEITELIEEEIDTYCQEHEIREQVDDFDHKGFRFQDVWEIDGEQYTFHYLYCLFSIVWAIQQYDAAKGNAISE